MLNMILFLCQNKSCM